jgi:hypothetical protein
MLEKILKASGYFMGFPTKVRKAAKQTNKQTKQKQCCCTYRVADPFSSLGIFSSSSIGSPVIHPIADCKHPLICLLGPGVVSLETDISGFLNGERSLQRLLFAQGHIARSWQSEDVSSI